MRTARSTPSMAALESVHVTAVRQSASAASLDWSSRKSFKIKRLRLICIFNINHIGVFLKTSLIMFSKTIIYGRLRK